MNSLKKTYLILLALIILIPLSFDNNIININALHRLLFSVFSFVLSLLILLSAKNLRQVFINKIFLTVSILFPVCMTISSVVNGNEILLYEDLSLIINLFAFSFLIIILTNLIDINTFLKFITVVIVISGLLFSFIGILQLFGYNFLNLISSTRPGSTLGIRNFASEYLISVIPFAFISLIVSKSKRIKALVLLVIICVLSYLFLLRSRAAIFTLIICLIFFTIFLIIINRKNIYKINIKGFVFSLTFVLIISFLIGLIQPPNVDSERKNLQTTITSTFDSDYGPNIARIKYTKTSFEIFKENPLFGIGTGAWFGVYPKYNGEDYTDENIFFTANINPHNDYLEILSENGIVTLLIFLILIFYTLYKLIKLSFKNIHFLAVATSFIGLLIVSLFSFPKNNTSAMILFFLAIGLANSAYTTADTDNKGQLKINFKLLSLMLSFVILVTIPYNFLRYEYEKDYISAMKDKASNNYSAMNEKLENILEEIYPADPNRMPLSYYKGVGYYQTKKYEKALYNFQSALSLSPFIPNILSNKAAALYALNETEKAETLLLNIKRMFPNYIEPQINLLAIYSNAERDSLAKKLIAELDNRNLQNEKIKNFTVFLNIKKHYYEKSFD